GDGLGLPQDDAGARPHHPLAVGRVDVDGHVPEGRAPLDARPVEVRVGDGDGPEAAARPDRLDRRVVEEADAVPEDVAGRGLDEESLLADTEGGDGGDAGEAGILLAEHVPVALGRHLGQCRPPLSLPPDVLALVLADRAAGRRRVAGGVLDAAGDAHASGHRSPPVARPGRDLRRRHRAAPMRRTTGEAPRAGGASPTVTAARSAAAASSAPSRPRAWTTASGRSGPTASPGPPTTASPTAGATSASACWPPPPRPPTARPPLRAPRRMTRPARSGKTGSRTGAWGRLDSGRSTRS